MTRRDHLERDEDGRESNERAERRAALKMDLHETLWVTDAEMIRRMGVPEKIARVTIHMLDRNPSSGFPKKQKSWGDRRYWPAVRQWLDKLNNVPPSRPP